MLSEKAVLEFRQIYKDEFGVELGDEALTKTANTVLEIFKVVYRPLDLNEGVGNGTIKEPPT